MPTVSICVPTYVQTKYLKRNLDSILRQDYQDYEIIVTDDTPGTEISDFLKGYDFRGRLHYHKNEIRLGSPRNWDRSIELATGKYIKILHHDDWFYEDNSLSRFVNLIQSSDDIDFAFSGTNIVSEANRPERIHSMTRQQFDQLQAMPEILFFGNIVGAPSATIFSRRSAMKFDARFKWLVDLEFYMRLIRKAKKIAYTTDPLICTITDALHSVTSECVDNKEVELYEYAQIYADIKKNVSVKEQLSLQNQLIFILRKYNVTSFLEFRKYYPSLIPPPKLIKYFVKQVLKGNLRTASYSS
jgi:glycosyltransferase involved in cell wall biosynthesis